MLRVYLKIIWSGFERRGQFRRSRKLRDKFWSSVMCPWGIVVQSWLFLYGSGGILTPFFHVGLLIAFKPHRPSSHCTPDPDKQVRKPAVPSFGTCGRLKPQKPSPRPQPPTTIRTQAAAAAAAKSLQSCPTLCDSIDGSPPGSPIPRILQARALEWGAISFSNAWKWKVKVKPLSRVRLLATPWTATYQAPPSMGFSRQKYWSGVPLPSPNPG